MPDSRAPGGLPGPPPATSGTVLSCAFHPRPAGHTGAHVSESTVTICYGDPADCITQAPFGTVCAMIVPAIAHPYGT
jgi:hypothetical protein